MRLLPLKYSTVKEDNSMDFKNVIRKRKMIRRYDSKQVSDETIRKLIRNAHRAPSAVLAKQRKKNQKKMNKQATE
jgi:predicted DNA-binding protein (MmcQ/YjbR family)